jgi:type I restriction enzyme S subunit
MTLPKDWVWTTIGEITEPIQKVDPRENPEKVFIYLDISSIDNSIQKIVTPKQYIGVDAPSRARQLVRANDVLFSTVRTYLKNVALVPEYCDGQVASTGFSILRATPEAMGRFLFYYSQTEAFLTPLNELQRGTSYPAVRDSDVRVQQIPLPSLPEQERIVERIESLFTQLDAGVAGLKHAQAALKRYKVSVLKAACEGRLVSQDPTDEPAEVSMKRILAEEGIVYHLPEGDLSVLPQGWIWNIFSLVIKKVKRGPSMKCNQEGRGVRYITSGNLDDGILRLDLDYKFLEGFNKIDSCKLLPNDLILNCVNSIEKIGKSAVFTLKLGDAIVGFNNYALELHEKVISPFYANIVCQSLFFKNQLYFLLKRAVNQVSFATRELDFLLIPIPPLAEQYRIIADVERRLLVVQELEQTIEANLKRVTRLRQAILKRAFEGML